MGLKNWENIYQTIFDKDKVIEHIFLRDYAKLIVESVNNQIKLNVDLFKIYPPYNQHLKWDLSTIDTSDVEEYRDDYLSIYHSALSGDFKIYIVYPFANHFLNLKIKDRPHPKSSKVRYNEFFDSLTKEQMAEYDKTRLQSNELDNALKNPDNFLRKFIS